MQLSMEYVAMRDGVRLFTRVFRPDQPGTYPTVLFRNPYDDPKRYALTEDYLPTADNEAFVTVVQSCRGTAASEGELVAYLHEREDGLDALAWIRKQPFYNGEIFLDGASYLSTVHLCYLDAKPADVKGALLKIQDSDRYNIHYENGQYKIGLHYHWVVGNLHTRYPEVSGTENDDAVMQLPHIGFRDRILRGKQIPTLDETYDAFHHPNPKDSYWKTTKGVCDSLNAMQSVDYPLFLATGHYDIYIHGIPKMWQQLRPEIRKKSMLVVTPYSHEWLGVTLNEAHRMENDKRETLRTIDARWLDYCRTDAAPDLDGLELGKANWYVLFGGRWVAEEFLTDGREERKLYLSKSFLQDAPSKGEATYTYDPAKPTTFLGTCGNVFGTMGAQDGIGTREDVLNFVSGPFEKTVTLKGVQKVLLSVRSDCEDTCFYVRLSLVKKDGTAYGLRDRITSLHHEFGTYTPGQTVQLALELDPVAAEVKAGEKLRLDVASAYWPQYIPHSNVAGKWCEVTQQKIAHNTVVYDNSFLVLRME